MDKAHNRKVLESPQHILETIPYLYPSIHALEYAMERNFLFEQEVVGMEAFLITSAHLIDSENHQMDIFEDYVFNILNESWASSFQSVSTHANKSLDSIIAMKSHDVSFTPLVASSSKTTTNDTVHPDIVGRGAHELLAPKIMVINFCCAKEPTLLHTFQSKVGGIDKFHKTYASCEHVHFRHAHISLVVEERVKNMHQLKMFPLIEVEVAGMSPSKKKIPVFTFTLVLEQEFKEPKSPVVWISKCTPRLGSRSRSGCVFSIARNKKGTSGGKSFNILSFTCDPLKDFLEVNPLSNKLKSMFARKRSNSFEETSDKNFTFRRKTLSEELRSPSMPSVNLSLSIGDNEDEFVFGVNTCKVNY